jgi:glycosyltransferase involved in cell wall biosynthesis
MMSLVYLGKRGGGALLAENCYRVGSNSDFVNRILISSKNELIFSSNSMNRVTSIPVSHDIYSFFRLPFNLIYQFFVSVYWAYKTRDDLIILLMPSPFDLLTILVIKIFNDKIIMICHDASAHDGESWPTVGAIKHRARLSNFVVALSTGEASRLRKMCPSVNISVIQHPELEIFVETEPLEIFGKTFQKPIFLFIGRIKRYKGIERLIESWSSQKLGTLLIAGEGDVKVALPENTFLINRWLAESEILYLIKFSDVVIFPYLSASQSGLIPLVRKSNKIVISSKMTGLMEQLEGYEANTIWIKESSVVGLSRSLNEYFDLERQFNYGEASETYHVSILAFLKGIQETWEMKAESDYRSA